MSDDLRELLHDTAPEPSRPLDAAAVVRRARRQTVGLRVAAGVVGLVVLASAAVGLARLWVDEVPQIVDNPPGDGAAAPVGVLDGPAGPDDQLPGWVVEELQVASEAAGTARLARRTPGRSFYVYADDTQTRSGPVVCVAVVHKTDRDVAQACGARQPVSRRQALVVLRSGFGTVGIVPDGITRARDTADGDQLPDVAVVNNLFIDLAVPDRAALEGRSDAAFCAVASEPDGITVSLADSADPVGLVEELATTAPAEIAQDTYLLWDYLRLRPDAIQTDTVALSEPLQEAADRIDSYIDSTCR